MQESAIILDELRQTFHDSLIGVRQERLVDNENYELYSYQLFLEITADKFVDSSTYLLGKAFIYLKNEKVQEAFKVVADRHGFKCTRNNNGTVYTLYRSKIEEGNKGEK